MKSLNRRSVIAGSAAAVTALPAVGLSAGATEGDDGELKGLIELHRAAYQAFGDAIDRLDEVKRKVRSPEVVVPCLLGGGFSLYAGYKFCQEHILSAYYNQARHLTKMDRIAPEVAGEYRAAIKAKLKENMSILDRMWEESGIPEAEKENAAASDAEWEAFQAICSYRCHTPEEAKIKAEYLLTTSIVRDSWEDEAKALLESFV